ncbi:hypothetical protein FB451DRAFT_304984 [Mycena latifolia]|nr:hypothetical protein FB451DRAFT_304984 [Mycena latifolia]
MEERLNPFRIQELVDQCIEFLHDSPRDLRACALVSRSCASAAQAHIFRQISIRSTALDDLWPRLQRTLHISPHLVRHIHRLQLDSEALSIETFSAVCEFPFTHLRYACIYHTNSDLPVGLALQQLLSLPTLRRVEIVATFPQPSTFRQIWDRCSPSIKHLELSCAVYPPEAVQSIAHPRSRSIAFESLKIGPIKYLSNWLLDDLCPLNLSRLRVLSIVPAHGAEFWWLKFAPTFQTLEVLDFTSWSASAGALDLSALPNLVLIRMGGMGGAAGQGLQTALVILSTIANPTRIRKIIIWHSWLDRGSCEQLDSKLVSLPVQHLPTLELEMALIGGGLKISNLEQSFPRLASRNLLSYIDGHDNWFEVSRVTINN